NIEHNLDNSNFTFIEGDIRDIQTCTHAVKGCDYVSHQAALGSVPRSIKDPITTNAVNIDGFLNIITAAKDSKVKRFVYASSSSVYGDSPKLPKVEDEIGTPLSPYAVTKYVNELYAGVFAKTYKMQCIGLRYFNVFGKRQDPNGAYAAVIPKWVKQLINHERPVINGDGSYSRDFTYIDNVLQANEKALFTSDEQIKKGLEEYYQNVVSQLENKNDKLKSETLENHTPIDPFNHSTIPPFNHSISEEFFFSEVFNIAYGANTTLLQLFNALTDSLAKHEPLISDIEPIFGPFRIGDIPHSQANIVKAREIIDYTPLYDANNGFKIAGEWYFKSITKK
ncbi:MAG: NAD-dependent epimerase/dehydratase family protein, partial [Ignavibacteriaceae bacterium]|nr:NAD-dependent epimerase/dehydratase family protein [Ignavibacteriaceae bacterium]